MSVVEHDLKFGGNATNKRADGFTILQTIALILLTIIVSACGWYLAGKYFFWSDLDQRRVNEQLEFLKQKVAAEPKNLEFRVALGYTYFLKGENDKAVSELNKVLAQDKNYYDAYYNLGLVYSDEERYDDALEMFQKTVEISPRDYKGHVQKGIVFRKMKKYKEATEALNKANELKPRSADIIYEIGRVAEDAGNFKAAVSIYKEALSFDPLYKEAAEALKRCSNK